MKKIAAKGSTEALLRSTIGHVGDACLLWPHAKSISGYGLAVVGGIQKHASRWMCVLAHGKPPSPKHEAAHSCGNRPCFNPNHLSWKTPVGNQSDRIKHGTHNRGERNGKTSLTSNDIRSIREAPPDLAALMERYGVSKGCVSKIRSGKRWGHIA